jgi:hypothetical protein
MRVRDQVLRGVLGKPVTVPGGDLDPSIDNRMFHHQLKMLVPIMLLSTAALLRALRTSSGFPVSSGRIPLRSQRRSSLTRDESGNCCRTEPAFDKVFSFASADLPVLAFGFSQENFRALGARQVFSEFLLEPQDSTGALPGPAQLGRLNR